MTVKNSIFGNHEDGVNKGAGFEKMGVAALNMIFSVIWYFRMTLLSVNN